MDLLAVSLYHTDPTNGRVMLHAMPVMILVLVCLTLAYRYYSAFLAAKVAVLDNSRITPAHRLNDGQNYHPTNKWVLFGHHFAAISGAGPLIGPVLAIQYGFMPGLLWLVIGVCLAGAVQDMLVLAASVRRDGKSLAEIARAELGYPAAIIASVAILFIVVIALAALGFVVVKALGGEEVKLPAGMRIDLPENGLITLVTESDKSGRVVYEFPPHSQIRYASGGKASERPEAFRIAVKPGAAEEYNGPLKYIDVIIVMDKGNGLSSDFSEMLVREAGKIPGVMDTAAAIVDLIEIKRDDGSREDVIIQGKSPDSFEINNITLVSGRRLIASDHGKAMLGSALAENLNKKVGNTIAIQGESFEVIGTFKSSMVFENGTAFLLLDDVQRFLGRVGRVTGFSVQVAKSSPDSTAEVESVREKIAALRDPKDPTVHLTTELSSFHPLRPLPILGTQDGHIPDSRYVLLPPGCSQIVPGSSWGTFTIACTIPIALLVGLWMYRIRKGRVVEASVIGGLLTLAAVVVGNWIPGSPLERFFSLTREQTLFALCIYGFIAAVLPVWLLLGPRDYLSSFMKIGTVVLLVVSVLIANPTLHAPPLNEVFMNGGGPTFSGALFPFVFICVMCGAISGFHSLVSSGTTPKMIDKESQIRHIGYGAMLIEGLVGTVALIAAASLPPDLYYDINVPIDRAPEFQKQLSEVHQKYGVSRESLPAESKDPLHATNVDSPQHLDLSQVEEKVGGEALRGRVGGAVTLAVGMSLIFSEAFRWFGVTGDWLLKYWYHFAIMFEALFILTTIDAGTRIARFLLQETAGRIYKPLARSDWLFGSMLASGLVTFGYGWLIYTGSIDTIYPMFGIANQLLAVLALALVTTWLVNNGRGRYAPVTVLPMLFVMSTTLTAGSQMVTGRFAKMIETGHKLIDNGQEAAGQKQLLTGYLNSGLTIFVIACVCTLVLWSIARWFAVWLGGRVKSQEVA